MPNIVINTLKKVLDLVLKSDYEVFLFGSQACNRNDDLSDWDFLVVTEERLPIKHIEEIKIKIYRSFHELLPTDPLDLVIVDRKTFELQKLIPNTISNEVFIEGKKI